MPTAPTPSRKREADPTVSKKAKRKAQVMSIPMDMDEVPDGILLLIFGKLSKLSQLRLKRISRRWQALLTQPALGYTTKIDVPEFNIAFEDSYDSHWALLKLATSNSTVSRLVFVANRDGKLRRCPTCKELPPKSKQLAREKQRQIPVRYGFDASEDDFKHVGAVVLDGVGITQDGLRSFVGGSKFPVGMELILNNARVYEIMCGMCSYYRDPKRVKHGSCECVKKLDVESYSGVLTPNYDGQDLADGCLAELGGEYAACAPMNNKRA